MCFICSNHVPLHMHTKYDKFEHIISTLLADQTVKKTFIYYCVTHENFRFVVTRLYKRKIKNSIIANTNQTIPKWLSKQEGGKQMKTQKEKLDKDTKRIH